MANEIRVTANVQLTNGELQEKFEPGTKQIDQSTAMSHSPTVIVGTSEEDLSTGDVSTEGWLFLWNLDSTNYVTWGPKSAGSMVAVGRLEAGEIAMLRMEPAVVLRWQANTAPVNVKVLLLED